MSKIKNITVHCSATSPDANFTMGNLRYAHVIVNGWRDIGYHWYIRRDGTVHACRPENVIGAHVKGHNTGNLGICMEGGVDERGGAENNFTENQFISLRNLIEKKMKQYGITNAPVGHRDWSPDLNNDGTIQANEYIKQCPCFNVGEWWFKDVKSTK